MEKVARELKEEGNQCFREKRYNKAAQLYTSSLEKLVDPVVLGNRAQTFIQLKHYQHAVMDCNKALEMDPKFAKALYRRAMALEALGLFRQARNDIERLLSITDDSAAKALLARIKNKVDIPCIELKACEKGDEIRSDGALVEISVECDEVQEEEQRAPRPSTSSQLTQHVADLSISLPLPPSSFPTFLSHFSMLKRNPAHFALYFMQIPPSQFHDLFDDLLDSDALSCLLSGLAQCFDNKDPRVQPLKVTQCLLHLAEISRFDMIAMFLSVEDKQNLQKICDQLSPLDSAAVQKKFSQ